MVAKVQTKKQIISKHQKILAPTNEEWVPKITKIHVACSLWVSYLGHTYTKKQSICLATCLIYFLLQLYRGFSLGIEPKNPCMYDFFLKLPTSEK
jgi:hypothetical protein